MINELKKQIKKLYKDYAFMHKAKNGFNLVIFDNKEKEILEFIINNGGKVVKLEKGVNWENRPYIEYYVELAKEVK